AHVVGCADAARRLLRFVDREAGRHAGRQARHTAPEDDGLRAATSRGHRRTRATRTVCANDRAAARQRVQRTMLLVPVFRFACGTGTSTIRTPSRNARPARITFGAKAFGGTAGSSRARMLRRKSR